MIRKRRPLLLGIFALAIIVLCICLEMIVLFSCTSNDSQIRDEISGKVFIWEKEGYGGNFTISLHNDGTYDYYVGPLSSYIGLGDWAVKNGILTLTEKSWPNTSFRFNVKDGELIFISEESSQFMHVSVENGDEFLQERRSRYP